MLMSACYHGRIYRQVCLPCSLWFSISVLTFACICTKHRVKLRLVTTLLVFQIFSHKPKFWTSCRDTSVRTNCRPSDQHCHVRAMLKIRGFAGHDSSFCTILYIFNSKSLSLHRCSRKDRCHRAEETFRFATDIDRCVKVIAHPDSIAVSAHSVPVSPLIIPPIAALSLHSRCRCLRAIAESSLVQPHVA